MRGLPMIRRKNLKVADCPMEVSQFVTGGWFYVFLSYLNRFVYGFCLIWNSSSSRVWLKLFEQGINANPGALLYGSINQSIKHKFLLIFQYLLFRRLRHIFLFHYEFLGVRRLKLGVFSSSV